MSFYIQLIISLIPWALMLAGAALRVRNANSRVRRLQVEGAGLIVFDIAVKWAVYDPNFGLTRTDTPLWANWFAYSDAGMFWIGLLLFAMGLLLELGPREESETGREGGKALHRACIILGSVIALAALVIHGVAWAEKPFSTARLAFTLGFYPFALNYYRWCREEMNTGMETEEKESGT